MNAYEIYQQAAPSLITEMLQWMRNDERDLYKSTVATLAQDRRLRPVFIQKKSVAEQFAWIHKTLQLKTSNLIGEHLFQVYFMKGQEPLLIAFCDAMEIPHDGKGSVEGDLPDTLDADKLKAAVDTLLASHSPQLVTLYLQVFNLQTQNGWESLTQLLASDERLKLN